MCSAAWESGSQLSKDIEILGQQNSTNLPLRTTASIGLSAPKPPPWRQVDFPQMVCDRLELVCASQHKVVVREAAFAEGHRPIIGKLTEEELDAIMKKGAKHQSLNLLQEPNHHRFDIVVAYDSPQRLTFYKTNLRGELIKAFRAANGSAWVVNLTGDDYREFEEQKAFWISMEPEFVEQYRRFRQTHHSPSSR